MHQTVQIARDRWSRGQVIRVTFGDVGDIQTVGEPGILMVMSLIGRS